MGLNEVRNLLVLRISKVLLFVLVEHLSPWSLWCVSGSDRTHSCTCPVSQAYWLEINRKVWNFCKLEGDTFLNNVLKVPTAAVWTFGEGGFKKSLPFLSLLSISSPPQLVTHPLPTTIPPPSYPLSLTHSPFRAIARAASPKGKMKLYTRYWEVSLLGRPLWKIKNKLNPQKRIFILYYLLKFI